MWPPRLDILIHGSVRVYPNDKLNGTRGQHCFRILKSLRPQARCRRVSIVNLTMHMFLWGGRSRQGSPSPFRRSMQCCYCPQNCGRSAGRSARDWRWIRWWRSRTEWLKVQEIRSSCDDHEVTRTSGTWATMWCAIKTTRTWLLDYAHMGSRLHSRVDVHVRCVECALSLGGHVVIGVVLGSPRKRKTKCRVLSFWIL